MVFVFMLFFFAFLIVLGLIFLNANLFRSPSDDFKIMLNRFLYDFNSNKYANILYVYIIAALIFMWNFWSITFAIFLIIFITYFQKHVWEITVERSILETPIFIRKRIKSFLIEAKSTITFKNLAQLLKLFFKSAKFNIVEYFRISIDEIKIVLNIINPTANLTKAQKELYEYQCSFFKYKKVEEFLVDIDSKTDEEVMEMYRKLKQRRNVSVGLNKYKPFPWKFTFKLEDNVFFKIAMSNIIIIYNFFKTTLVAVFLMVIYFLYTIFFFKIQFLKQLAVWFVIGMLYFWLMSGFNFFLKRYQYGKFTSQIQRFWKRTNTYFWLIEGFLLLLFFYYYLNSSQEPLYMYDYSSINQEYLVSLHSIGMNVVLLSVIIYFMYFTLLRLNSNSWTQINLYLICISSFIFFSFFIETYQFYYVISVFNERLWVFNEEENMWSIDVDNPILRTKHHYLLVCLIAKYWHFLFIFLSWVFFLVKSFERKKVTFVLFGANLQNMIILYLLNFACYLQWFKWIYRRFFDLPYTWFFINIDNKFIFRLFFECKLLLNNLLATNGTVTSFSSVIYKSLTLWNVDSLSMWKFI